MTPTDTHDQPLQTVARNALGEVLLCDCGQLHLHLPQLQLRLSPGGLLSLHELLAQAARALEAVADEVAQAQRLGLRSIH